jgi:hypothetical protein
MNVRYLYTHGRSAVFIAEIGLHEVPRDEWRDRLLLGLGDLMRE